MPERVSKLFPYAIAVILPLAGLLLAAVRATDGDRDGALRLGLAAVAGGLLYAVLLL